MKQCAHETCKYNVFGGKFCLIHQFLRKDKKPNTLNRTPIKKISDKQKKLLGEGKKLWKADKEFYLSIWEERDHICYETGAYLGEEPLSLFFHHVLPKEFYPQFRHKKWNIVILSWEAHDRVEKDLDKSPKVKKLHEFLTKKYL